MYSPFHIALKYFKYYFTASNGKGHGMHSPFVFEFITKILNDTKKYPDYDAVEGLRKQLLNDKTELRVQDLGAGSSVSNSKKRTLNSIARSAAKPAKYGQLLYRMAKHYQPKTILELGTSLGITTSYLAAANRDASVLTMEGSPEIAARAKQHFTGLQLPHVKVVEGNFDDTLPAILRQLASVDFAFIDGNHRKEPTERYFQQLLSHVHNDSILIFDDIHWSREMEEAWNTIRKHERVRGTIDLFFIGIVLFRQEFKAKQHFVIRF
jgi:predicted O-methyltransferase YrrM